VVGHDVDQVTEAGAGKRVGQSFERRLVADLGVQRIVIDDVVAVRAAGARLQIR
jgi:hypothetical protein